MLSGRSARKISKYIAPRKVRRSSVDSMAEDFSAKLDKITAKRENEKILKIGINVWYSFVKGFIGFTIILREK